MTTITAAQSGRRAARVRPAAFASLLRNEARLAFRQPAGMIAGAGIALVITVAFGEIPYFNKASGGLGGYTTFDVYVPILMCFSMTIIAFMYLPGPLVSYREMRILRRMSTTPVPAYWVLAAQLVVQACLMTATLALIVIVSAVFFGIGFPDDPAAMVLTLALSMAALFAVGLMIAAASRTANAARGLMAAAMYPLLFCGGLYYPMNLMPAVIRDISDCTPLGAAVPAISSAWAGHFPPAQMLLVLAGYAVVFGYLALRFFRWE